MRLHGRGQLLEVVKQLVDDVVQGATSDTRGAKSRESHTPHLPSEIARLEEVLEHFNIVMAEGAT